MYKTSIHYSVLCNIHVLKYAYIQCATNIGYSTQIYHTCFQIVTVMTCPFDLQISGSDTSYRIVNLEPFMMYNFALEACTEGGCTRSSDSLPLRTLEDCKSEHNYNPRADYKRLLIPKLPKILWLLK